MICFEIYINHDKVCVVGVDGYGVISAIMHCARRKQTKEIKDCDIDSEELKFHVGGTTEDNKILKWLDKDLNVGEEITIRVVDSDTFDSPNGLEVFLAEKTRSTGQIQIAEIDRVEPKYSADENE